MSCSRIRIEPSILTDGNDLDLIRYWIFLFDNPRKYAASSMFNINGGLVRISSCVRSVALALFAMHGSCVPLQQKSWTNGYHVLAGIFTLGLCPLVEA